MSYHKLVMENNTMFTKMVFEKLSDRDLTKGQPKILEYLYSNDGAVQKDIAKSCFIEPATVTNLLYRMEKKDLIYRRVDENNRRYLYVYLTEKGKAEASNVMKAFDILEDIALKNLDEQEIDTLISLLDKVNQTLKEYKNI